MGGQDNASTLIPAILGLGGNVTGIAVNRPGLGQPLTQFSQQMQERELQQQRLQQQAAQEAVRREQTERRLNLQEQQQQAYLQSLQENQKLRKQSIQTQEKNLDLRQKEFERQINKDAKTQLNTQAAIIRLQKAGAYLNAQQQLQLDALLKEGKISEASNFIQKSDQYARIRNLQEQGKLDPNNFNEQIRGLYPEFKKEEMKNFLTGARKTFVEDPGWFKEKKLIPQTPTQMPTDGWSMTKKTP